MTITLNHTIVRARDRHASARFLARLIGLPVSPPSGPFTPVKVNDDLTLDFDDRFELSTSHYAFHVDDTLFDQILTNIESSGAQYGAGPDQGWNRQINHEFAGRGVYVLGPEGHTYEFFTRTP